MATDNMELAVLERGWSPENGVDPWHWIALPQSQRQLSTHGGAVLYLDRKAYHRDTWQPRPELTLWSSGGERIATRRVPSTPIYLRVKATAAGDVVTFKGYSMISGGQMFTHTAPAGELVWCSRLIQAVRAVLLSRGLAYAATPIVLFGRNEEQPMSGLLWDGSCDKRRQLPMMRLKGKQDPRSSRLRLFMHRACR